MERNMTKQQEIFLSEDYSELDRFLKEESAKKIFLVCDGSYKFLKIRKYFDNIKDVEIIKFSDFQPNPDYTSLIKAIEFYKQEGCDMIIAVGGGSAMDLAKCVKLYATMDTNDVYFKQPIVPNDIKLVVVPTTAGTGSEATRYAVIYYEGEKQSIADYSCIPSTVFFDVSSLDTLPDYQRKSTMLDALCHAMESFWSVNSTEESKEFSRQAIKMILDNKESYLANEKNGNKNMLKAANIAGKAINITQTTAGHAMCYKLTSLYGKAHGHAAAMCVSKLMPYMINNTDKCIDSRGSEYLNNLFKELAAVMGCDSTDGMCDKFDRIFNELNLPSINYKEEDIKILRTSVNPIRLKNNPVSLDVETIDMLYHQILGKNKGVNNEG